MKSAWKVELTSDAVSIDNGQEGSAEDLVVNAGHFFSGQPTVHVGNDQRSHERFDTMPKPNAEVQDPRRMDAVKT